MDISVPSRFACLKIEDDDFRPSSNKQNDQKKKDKQVPKKIVSKQDQTVKKCKQPVVEKKGKRKNVSAKQWEEWKERDSELVDGNFEQDLQNAILLSKLDYEEKKDVYGQAEKEANDKKKAVLNKKKKNKAMSLDQFLSNRENNNSNANDIKPNAIDTDKFFERVQMEIKEELTKEKIMEKRKERQVNIEEIISIAQCQEKLKIEQNKNLILEKELEEAKREIKLVKERNKKLCGILGYGEMKDKADVLIEVERLNAVKDELTEEVRRLHELLEQERSKVPNSMMDGHVNKHNKEKRSKKHAT